VKKKEFFDRPFGSSYYYAHNNLKATGGYKDGLRTEDYVMNQPRLLSKNGVMISDARETTVSKTPKIEMTLTKMQAPKKI